MFSGPSSPQIPVVRPSESKTWLRHLQADSGRSTRPGWLGDPGFCRCSNTTP